VAKKLPVFGICLGHQLLGLASGARTLKMSSPPWCNHPVVDVEVAVMITARITASRWMRALCRSACVSRTLAVRRHHPRVWRAPMHRRSVPGHPEASPGPHDVAPLFDHFNFAHAATQDCLNHAEAH